MPDFLGFCPALRYHRTHRVHSEETVHHTTTIPRTGRVSLLLTVCCLLWAAALSGCMGMGTGNPDTDSASFTAQGNMALMRGIIDRNTSTALLDMMSDNESVKTIVMQHVPGSTGYRENREAARMLKDYRLATHVPADGYISPEGLDFFIGGWKRTAAPGARIAVGSWYDGQTYGADLPRHHSLHFGYLAWYRDHGIPDDFYWFSLQAAPKGEYHILTQEELLKYRIITQ